MATLFSAARVSTELVELRCDVVWVCAHTVHREVTEGGTRCTLHLNVWVLEQEQDGLQRVPVDLSDIYGKCY